MSARSMAWSPGVARRIGRKKSQQVSVPVDQRIPVRQLHGRMLAIVSGYYSAASVFLDLRSIAPVKILRLDIAQSDLLCYGGIKHEGGPREQKGDIIRAEGSQIPKRPTSKQNANKRCGAAQIPSSVPRIAPEASIKSPSSSATSS